MFSKSIPYSGLTQSLLIFFIFLFYTSLSANDSGFGQKSLSENNFNSSVKQSLIQKAQDDGTVKVIVKLKAGNTRKYKKPASVAEIEAQRMPIQNAQDVFLSRLKSNLQGKNAGVFSNIIQYKTIPFIALTLDEKALRKVYSHPLVLGVTEDTFHKLALAESVPWSHGGYGGVIDEEYDGSGWAVVIMDSGVKIGHHHFLEDRDDPMEEGEIDSDKTRIIDGACFINDCPGGQSPEYGVAAAQACWDPTLPCHHHGTHVTGIAAGSETTGDQTTSPPDPVIAQGVAPGADIISMNVLSSSRGPSGHQEFGVYLSISLLALERTYELSHLVDPENGFPIAAVNMSYGNGSHSQPCVSDSGITPINAIMDQLQVLQIAIVAASGNDSSDTGIISAACSPSTIAVGSTAENEYVISNFSNHNDLVDLLAPGSGIRSATAHSRTSSVSTGGTSMAAPHVAGAFAVLRQAKPDASLSNIYYALQETGRPISVRQNGTDTGIVKPLIDIPAAKSLLLSSTFEPKPDLIAKPPIIRDEQFNSSGNFEFSIDAPVRNIGSEISPETSVYVYLSTDDVIEESADILIGGGTVSTLPFNDSDITSISNIEVDPSERYWVGACVDQEPEESDIDNNCSEAVEVRELQPDLEVIDVTRSDYWVTQGQQLTLTSTTQNFSMKPSPATTMQFYLSTDKTITTGDIPVSDPLQIAPLPLNGSGEHVNSATVYVPPTPGEYWVGACVRAELEQNTDNNCSYGPLISITEDLAPDMTIEGKVHLTIHNDDGTLSEDGMIHPGTLLTLYATAKNIGQGANNYDAKLTAYLSDDGVIEPDLDTPRGQEVVVGLLNVGQTEEHSFSIIAPSAGYHYLGACVKLPSYEGESNLENNCSSPVEFLVSDPSAAD